MCRYSTLLHRLFSSILFLSSVLLKPFMILISKHFHHQFKRGADGENCAPHPTSVRAPTILAIHVSSSVCWASSAWLREAGLCGHVNKCSWSTRIYHWPCPSLRSYVSIYSLPRESMPLLYPKRKLLEHPPNSATGGGPVQRSTDARCPGDGGALLSLSQISLLSQCPLPPAPLRFGGGERWHEEVAGLPAWTSADFFCFLFSIIIVRSVHMRIQWWLSFSTPVCNWRWWG